MMQALELLQAAMIADTSIPKDTSGGFSGVYLEPAKEEIGNQAVAYRFLFARLNTDLPGMVTLFFDCNIYDTNQARVLTTAIHIIKNYSIPKRRQQFLGADWRIDELHFQDLRQFSKPKLTVEGGACYQLPIQTVAVIKPVGVF